MKKSSAKNGQLKNPPARRIRPLPVIIGLIACVLLVYGQSIRFGFVRDDEPIHLSENPCLNGKNGIDLPRLWRAPYQGMYIPVSYTVWAAVKEAGQAFLGAAPAFHPSVFHGFNIFLHAINVTLLFMLFLRWGRSRWASAAGVLLFALHPLQAESVAWVSELRGLLCALFCFSALLSYAAVSSDKRKTVSLYLLSVMLYVAALLSKPSAAVLPIVAMIADYFITRRSFRQTLLRALPLCAITIPLAFIAKEAQPDSYLQTVAPMHLRPVLWTFSMVFYTWKLVWPMHLATSYALTPKAILALPGVWFSPLVLVGLVYVVWRIRKRHPSATAAVLIAVSGFLTVSSLIPFAYQKWSCVADRFFYLSMTGVALGCALLYERCRPLWARAAFWTLIAAYGLQNAMVQVPVWRDEFTLWHHCIRMVPGESQAFFYLGDLYQKKGMIDRALDYYNKGLLLKPGDDGGLVSRGLVWTGRREYDKALHDFAAAIETNPKNNEAYNNRGNVFLYQGAYAAALADFNTCSTLSPGDYRPLIGKANALRLLGDFPAALAVFSIAERMNADDPAICLSRGELYAAQRKPAEALAEFARAIMLDRSLAAAYFWRARIFFESRQFESAVDELEKGIAFAPTNCTAFENLAKAHLFSNKPEAAWEAIRRGKAAGCNVNAALVDSVGKYTGMAKAGKPRKSF